MIDHVELGRFMLTLAVGAVGSIAARRAKIPAGGMVGAMVLVMAFNLLTNLGVFYRDLRIVVQIGAGAMIGSRMKRSHLKALRQLIGPMVIIWTGMIIMNFTVGYSMDRFTDIDTATAFFSSAPGGMADMAIIAADLGANPARVAILQLVRVMTIMIFMPPIFKRMGKKNPGGDEAARMEREAQVIEKLDRREGAIRLLITVAIGAAGGLIFRALGVPAGPMIGSMAFVTAYSIITDKAYYPRVIRSYTQIISGVYTGMRMDRASFFTLPELIIPALIMMASVFIFTFAISFVMRKLTKVPAGVAMMSSSPGGMQELSMLADDLGLDSPTIALLQSTRLMFVVAVFPTMLTFIIGAFTK